MTRRWCVAAAVVPLAGCGLLEPSFTSTEISGTVYRGSEPVPGAVVAMEFSIPAGSRSIWSAGVVWDTTDADGRYTILPEDYYRSHDLTCDERPVMRVKVRSSSRFSLRLYSVFEDVDMLVECGESQRGVDLSFPDEVWYGGVRIEGDVIVNDTIFARLPYYLIPPLLQARFDVSAVPIPGYVDADSVDWVWIGDEPVDWDLGAGLSDATFLYGNFYGDPYEPTPPRVLLFQPTAVGTTSIVATWGSVLGGASPFSDTVVVVVQ